jgi:hypothetical protein
VGNFATKSEIPLTVLSGRPILNRRAIAVVDEGRGAMKECRRCRRAMVEISLEVSSGVRTLLSCSHCDERIWLHDGVPVGRSGVLQDIATDAAARRTALGR